jgi:CRISPR system Cascade subunit CasA
MPEGEADIAAISLKSSYMSTLCSLSRFVLLKDDGIIYMEGLQYPTHKEGWREPFMTYSPEGKMLWLDMDKKPWRSLTAILSAAYASGSSKFECPQVKLLLGRARNEHLPIIGIWSGGLKFRTTAGDSSVKQDDDYIESAVFFDPDDLGELWFNELHSKMEALELLSSTLWKAVNGYYRQMSVKDSPATGKATGEFWSLCEQQFQNLVDSIGDEQRVRKLQLLFARFVESTYDKYCSNESAKQMSEWANNRPNVSIYLAEDKK